MIDVYVLVFSTFAKASAFRQQTDGSDAILIYATTYMFVSFMQINTSSCVHETSGGGGGDWRDECATCD